MLQGHGLTLAHGPDRLPEVRVRVLHQPAHQARTDVLHVLLPAPLQVSCVLWAELPNRICATFICIMWIRIRRAKMSPRKEENFFGLLLKIWMSMKIWSPWFLEVSIVYGTRNQNSGYRSHFSLWCGSGSVSCSSWKWCKSTTASLQILHGSIVGLHCERSKLSMVLHFESLKILNFDVNPDQDPDPAFSLKCDPDPAFSL